MDSILKATQVYLNEYLREISNEVLKEDLKPFIKRQVKVRCKWQAAERWGDFSSNYALALAAGEISGARKIAALICDQVPQDKLGWIRDIRLEANGHLSIYLHPRWFRRIIPNVKAKLARSKARCNEQNFCSQMRERKAQPGSAYWRGLLIYYAIQRLACTLATPCKYQWDQQAKLQLTCVESGETAKSREMVVKGFRLTNNTYKQKDLTLEGQVGDDVLRFFAFCHNPGRMVTIDASSCSLLQRKNPYYAIQYVQSRINNFCQQELGMVFQGLPVALGGYQKRLLKQVAAYFDILESAYESLQFQQLTAYLFQLSVLTLDWSVWQNHTGKIDFCDYQLLETIGEILAISLEILGIKPVEKM